MRLTITKTPKVYVGGAFIRSESGRVLPVYHRVDKAKLLGNVPRCTRKDLRNAIEAASAAGPGWAKRTGYNRGQILYRLAEMIESRADEMAASIGLSTDALPDAAASEVGAVVDRLVYYAGWADKYAQVVGNTNPVSGPYFNFTLPEPMGVVGVITDEAAPSLLGLVSQIAPIIVSGNTAVAFAPEAAPLPAILLGEMLAVSDLPAGVINLLTGKRAELLPTFATHEALRALDAAGVSDAERKVLGMGAAESVKRLKTRGAGEVDWLSETAQGVEEIAEFIEYKTVWHPVGA
jgi:acyl-CoA reductase-like NAD-dependent aldehyde dehydrogenase